MTEQENSDQAAAEEYTAGDWSKTGSLDGAIYKAFLSGIAHERQRTEERLKAARAEAKL